jgi:hypothetical protein
VALASTFLVLDVVVAICLTTKTLWLIVVLLAIARAVLLKATTNTTNVCGTNLHFPLMMPHLHDAVSSRMKTFPDISTVSS